MRTSIACSLSGILVAMLISATALANPGARLVYSRTLEAASCPDEDALRKAVAARVGYDSFFPWAKRTVLVSLSRDGGAFVATVDLVDEEGTKHGGHQLRGPSPCTDLLDAVALSVAIAIDPQLLLAKPPKPPEESAAPAPPVELPAPPPPPPAAEVATGEPPKPTEHRKPSPLGVEVSLGPAVAVGLLSGPHAEPSLGGTLGAALRWRQFSLGLETFVAAPTSFGAGSGASISSWPVLVSLIPCVSFGRLFACGLAETGVVFSSPEGTSGAQSNSSVWGALGARVGVAFPLLDRLSLRVHVDGVGDLSPARLTLNGHGEWSAPPVAGTLGIDLAWRFR